MGRLLGKTSAICRSIVEGEIKTFLIASKTKLSSLKSGTIPRLELVAALLAARLSKSVECALGEMVQGSHFWSDSTIVLSWIRSHIANSGQFVQRRLLEIRELTDVKSWYYVPSEENPADIPSRGLRVGDLRECQLWWQGPDFLKHKEENWLSQAAKVEDVCTTVAVVESLSEVGLLGVVDCRRYSKYSRFVRVVEVVLSVLERLRKMRFRRKERQAEKMILMAVQRAGLLEELRFLTKQENIQPSRVKELRLFLSTDGLIRCQTRLAEAEFLSFDAKNPILLPAGEYVTDLVIMHFHEKVGHGSERCTVSVLREKFWVVKARQQVRRVIKQCTFCKRYKRSSYRVPAEANLPVERLSKAAAFTHIGVDFAGPLYLKYFDPEVGSNKAYICLFTCASSRAVHLEVTQSLTVAAFMRAFKRFVARRGSPVTVYSDNGRTFRGASEDVKTFVSFLSQSCSHPGVDWKFNVELAPWWGGFWERLVRSVKEPLRKALGRNVIGYDELVTVVTEVEAIVNSRPLGYLYMDDPSECLPLTPSHLIIGRSLLGSAVEVPENSLRSIQRRQQFMKTLVDQFWAVWSKEYLIELRQFFTSPANNLSNPIPKENDIVLLNEKRPRHCWRIGKLSKLIVGRDGQARAAEVVSSGKTFRRPLQLISPLEIFQE